MSEEEVKEIDVFHVLPRKDIREHQEEGEACECHPEIQVFDNGNVLITHNSFDKREDNE